MKLDRKFYNRDTLIVAQELLGKKLIRKNNNEITSGIIVEVEAYVGPFDKAAHTYNNLRTSRTEIFFGEGGYSYVYLIYGMYSCFNIVSNGKNKPEAILIRALEPVDGIDIMKKRRNMDKIKNLCNGPGKLCQALSIDKNDYGIDLCKDQIYLEKYLENIKIKSTPRINIDYAEEAKDYNWRFVIEDSKYLSKNI